MDIEQSNKCEITSENIVNSSPMTATENAELYDNCDDLDDIDFNNISDKKPEDKTHKTT